VLFVLMVAEAGYRGSFPKSLGIGGVSGEMHDSKALASEATAALAVANAKLDGALDQIRQLEALQEVLRLDVEALREGTTTNLGEPNQGTMGGHERPAP
jgi:hypothetical protein